MERKKMSEAVEVAAAEQLCRRCKRRFDRSRNTPSSCSFHPSFFVCRRHDDQKRYYELGPDDPPYAAKFYDCCGAEDPDAPGIATRQFPASPRSMHDRTERNSMYSGKS